jgi:hypothetical protein
MQALCQFPRTFGSAYRGGFIIFEIPGSIAFQIISGVLRSSQHRSFLDNFSEGVDAGDAGWRLPVVPGGGRVRIIGSLRVGNPVLQGEEEARCFST